MKTFRNTKYTKRNYDCTNIVACQALSAPGPEWVECEPEIVEKLTQLYLQNGVRYFGHL